jgi:hypothetical protein
MELDKTQLVTDVSSSIWEASDPFGEKGPFSEQDAMVQFSVKAQFLPVINATIPHVEKSVKDKIRSIINTGHAIGLDADGILLDIDMELG